jgi:hypothetical protein
MGNELDLGKTFATLQFFNFIQQPLTWFPQILSTFSMILIASRMSCSPRRMLRFLIHIIP